MKTYKHLCGLLFNEPWVILPAKMEAISAAFELRLQGQQLSEDEVNLITGGGRSAATAAAVPQQERPAHQPGKHIAVLPLFGTLTQHGGGMRGSGSTTTEGFSRDFRRALADPEIGSLVIEINSPGGSVYGTQELAELVYASRPQKQIVSVVNSMAASGAYWIGSAAHEVVITPGGEVGSIGVVTMHVDVSKLEEQMGVKTTLVALPRKKIQGHPYEPLSAEALAEIDAKQQTIYGRFTQAVARHRAVKESRVRSGFGQGGMMLAQEAVDEGMADRVATLDQVVAQIAAGGKSRGGAKSTRNANALKLAEAEH